MNIFEVGTVVNFDLKLENRIYQIETKTIIVEDEPKTIADVYHKIKYTTLPKIWITTFVIIKEPFDVDFFKEKYWNGEEQTAQKIKEALYDKLILELTKEQKTKETVNKTV